MPVLPLLKAPKERPAPEHSGKTDLLLRFFDSHFFDEWIALTYLYKSNSAGVQDYLCNRLYGLPEAGLERYLLQLVQLVVLRPHSSLERVVVDLCARSLRVAVKVYWLLLAYTQDHPKDRNAIELRDRCEQAAMEGYWEPPFKDPTLLPLSPQHSNKMFSPPLSPTNPRSPGIANAGQYAFSPTSRHAEGVVSPGVMSPGLLSPERYASPEYFSRPTSPDGLGGAMYSSYTMGQGLEGLICASPESVRRTRHTQSGAAAWPEPSDVSRGAEPSPSRADRYSKLKEELGDGEGISHLLERSNGAVDGLVAAEDAVSPPSSPRQRQTVFGATLDFIEALCDASRGLTSFAEEDRQWALRRGLEEISKEIELASRAGVAIWFPMGSGDQRIVRLAAREARLLNSREKAPFMLILEVLKEDAADLKQQHTTVLEQTHTHGHRQDRSASNGPGTDAGDAARRESGSLAGMGPGSVSDLGLVASSAGRRGHRSSVGDRAMAQSMGGDGVSSKALATRRSLSFNNGSASMAQRALEQDEAHGSPGSSKHASEDAESSTSTTHGKSEDSFTAGLNKAMEGLRGSGPLVSVWLEVLHQGRSQPSGALQGPGQHPAGITGSMDDARPDGANGRGLAFLSRLGFGRSPAAIEGHAEAHEDGHVRVHLMANGGVDLRLNSLSTRHKRVPSHEALNKMAAQHNSPLPALDRVPPSPGIARDRWPSPHSSEHAERYNSPASHASVGASRESVETAAAAAGVVPRPISAIPAAGDPQSPSADGVAVAADFVRAAEAETDLEKRVARKRNAAARIYGERFQDRAKRIQKQSPYGQRPGWTIRPVIVKSGDDCRQELLAMQLINAFHDIFKEASMPLWLRPFEVLVTSNRTSLIEMVPNTLSIHAIKSKCPPGTSLRDFFFTLFPQGAASCKTAQRNYVESMAGYSIVCYLLQIKDRHNGNILLDDEGHIIHIDFGFMLSNSPGGVNFESAPFKLTRELLELMDSDSEGHASELFDYFKVLCIQGFLACRKHADRVLLLVEMMAGSGFPCFKSARTVQNLRRRFHLNLTEAQCVEVVLTMISDSLDAWRTRQYDYYQRVLNGIL